MHTYVACDPRLLVPWSRDQPLTDGLPPRSIAADRPADPVCGLPSRQLLCPKPQDNIPRRMAHPPRLPWEPSPSRRQRST